MRREATQEHQRATRIGGQQGLLAAGIGLLLALVLVGSLLAADGVALGSQLARFGYWLNLGIGGLIQLLGGYGYGRLAGRQILLSRRSWLLVGGGWGLAVLLTTSLLSGWTGFFQEGLGHLGTADEPFEDYIYKPFFWLFTGGLLPAMLVGSWFGWRVRKRFKGD
ncbi:hypothetical protein [Fibrella forsythiae]|uniref:Uncharacterized protein n=1 Tax=Fibrella forsythiae TaxID=2817061 RepID=A0ABS3JWN5_9BACT|nr:hypothetical protein [Fibrella forsythiae]MBO0953312.1 hypothetical protein [Fibrella forsythiae]